MNTLDEAAARLAQLSRQPLRPFATQDFGRVKNGDARSVVVPEDDARDLVAALKSELGPGLITFIGCTHSLAAPPDVGSEVVVATGTDQFDILRVAQSDAINYDMETEDLVKKLAEYDAKYGIEIFHAETDTIEFKLKRLPSDLKAFAHELYKFCPDIVDQGVGSVEELEGAIRETQSVYLWWD